MLFTRSSSHHTGLLTGGPNTPVHQLRLIVYYQGIIYLWIVYHVWDKIYRRLAVTCVNSVSEAIEAG